MERGDKDRDGARFNLLHRARIEAREFTKALAE
jgi:hypothetical protein